MFITQFWQTTSLLCLRNKDNRTDVNMTTFYSMGLHIYHALNFDNSVVWQRTCAIPLCTIEKKFQLQKCFIACKPGTCIWCKLWKFFLSLNHIMVHFIISSKLSWKRSWISISAQKPSSKGIIPFLNYFCSKTFSFFFVLAFLKSYRKPFWF